MCQFSGFCKLRHFKFFESLPLIERFVPGSANLISRRHIQCSYLYTLELEVCQYMGEEEEATLIRPHTHGSVTNSLSFSAATTATEQFALSGSLCLAETES